MSETTFEIAGVQYNVVKKGVGQAAQVADLGRWLSIYGAPAFRALQEDSSLTSMGGLDLLASLVGTLSADSLLELYALVFGCSMKVAQEEFDVAQLIDGVLALYENQPTVKRLIARFFGGTPIIEATPEPFTSSE